MRVSWTVVDANGLQFAGETTERPTGEFLGLQNDVAAQVRVALTNREPPPPKPLPDDGRFRQDRYLEEVGYMTHYEDDESVEKSIEILEGLGDSAMVEAALGRAYLRKFRNTGAHEWAALAETACKSAAAKDPESSITHSTMGELYLVTSKWAASETEFRRALEIRPSDADAMLGLGETLGGRIAGKTPMRL